MFGLRYILGAHEPRASIVLVCVLIQVAGARKFESGSVSPMSLISGKDINSMNF